MGIDTSKISKLGFGFMRLPLKDGKDQTSIDIAQVKQMVDAYMQGGGNYFDTAFVYHDGTSERALREALVERYPRDAYYVATKCLAWAEPDEATAKGNLDISLERMGLDYIDFYLLHNVGGKRVEKFDEYGMWDFVQEQKAAGKVRHIGFSMHDNAAMLERLLTEHPEMEFVQLQVNYLDWDDPVTESRKCMEVAARHGVPVIIMEPARGGRLIGSLPESAANLLQAVNPQASLASWAYRFCMSLPNTITTLSGMSTLGQVQQNMADFKEFRPLSDGERDVIGEAIDLIRAQNANDCTNCRYCMKACPQGVLIPTILGLMNLESQLNDRAFVKDLYSWQAREGYASECIQCGDCEDMCPQRIDIIHQLETAAERYE